MEGFPVPHAVLSALSAEKIHAGHTHSLSVSQSRLKLWPKILHVQILNGNLLTWTFSHILISCF